MQERRAGEFAGKEWGVGLIRTLSHFHAFMFAESFLGFIWG